MRALNSYIFRQLAGAFAFFFVALTGVLWLTQSLRSVDLIVNKGLSIGLFFYMTLLLLPWLLTLVLPIALFAAVLYTYHRLTAESELLVMWSAGISSWQLARPALQLAGLTTLLLFSLTLYFMPVGYREWKEMKASLRTSISHLLLQEGAFNTIGDGLTIYVRAREPGGELLGLLVHDNRDRAEPVTMMAESGALVSTPAGPRFVMVNGNRQSVDRESGQLSLLYFDRYALDLSQFVHQDSDRWLEDKERFLHELFDPGESPDDIRNADRFMAEGHDRIASSLYPIAFATVALAAALGGQFSRRGYLWRIVTAVVAVTLVRLAGLGALSLAAKVPPLAVLLYLNIAVAIAASAYMLSRPSRHVPAEAPAAEMAPEGAS